MSHKVNLVRVLTTATGNSTPITLGARYSTLFKTPAEAGAIDGRTYTYLIVDGNDYEYGRGVYTASGTSLSRNALESRVAGTLGTSRLNLSGTAQVRFVELAEDMDGVRGTRAVTGTTDVLMNSDHGYVVTFSNASAVAASLAQAGTGNAFLDGWTLFVKNKGAGAVTITPATSTIDGAATLVLAQNQGAMIWSDGTNYQAFRLGNIWDGPVPLTSAQRGQAAANLQIVMPPQGRLTLASATPVMTTNQSAKTTIYYTPYIGNQIPIYDGTNFVPTAFAEISVATTDTTKNPSAIGASKVNDWFVWNDNGTLRLTHGPDWTNDTTRSNGISYASGILVNNDPVTNGPAATRGTYVGTTRSNASSQLDWIYGGAATGGSPAWFGVWNAYNRVEVSTQVTDTTVIWTSPQNTVRALDNSNNNRVSYICGIAEDVISARVQYVAAGSVGGDNIGVGIGYDSVSVISGAVSTVGGTLFVPCLGEFATTSQGFHVMQALDVHQGNTATASVLGQFAPGYVQGALTVKLKA